MSVSDVSQKAIANLGWTDIRMPAPVFHGDTLYAESEVLEKRESRSRPTQGIVTIATRAHKADGTLVMEFKRSMLIPKRGHAVDDRIEAQAPRRDEFLDRAEAQARRLLAIGDEPRQIIRRPRLHARWNFFGEKLEEKLGHRALTSQRREDAALGPFSPASGKEKKDFRRPLLSLSLSRLRERRGPGNALALPGK